MQSRGSPDFATGRLARVSAILFHGLRQGWRALGRNHE
jgi:hypothetical protein